MSNSLAHCLPQQALCRPSVVESQSRAQNGNSASLLCGIPSPLRAEIAANYSKQQLSTRFLGNKLSASTTRLLHRKHRPVFMVPRAVLAADHASEVILFLLISWSFIYIYLILLGQLVYENSACNTSCFSSRDYYNVYL